MQRFPAGPAIRGSLAGLLILGGGTAATAQLRATEADKLVTTDADTNARAGFALALSGKVLAVGAHWDSEAEDRAGAAYIYVESDAGWSESYKILAADAARDDEFGFDVDLSGNVVVVGARFDDDHGPKSGSAYIYRQHLGAWVEEAKLTAADAAGYSEFGTCVAISGTLIAVGAPYDDGANVNAGAVYMYHYDGTGWTEQAKLLSPDPRLGDAFGSAIALNGNTLLVGAPSADGGASNAGIVFAYRYDGTAWQQVDQLTADDRTSNDNFGSAVALNGDYALIGAPGDDDGGTSTGSAYMFEYHDNAWTQSAKLTAALPEPFDEFGDSVALWGQSAIVSCPFDDDDGTNSGSAFLYYLTDQGWEQQVKLIASDAAATDGFGRAVTIGKSGAMIGAPFDDDGGSASGAAYFFGGTGDCDGNGVVDLADLVAGQAGDDDGNGTPDSCCPGDIDGDGRVFLTDLGIFLAMYGTFAPAPLPSDIDGNGFVGLEDLAILLEAFGSTCQ